MIEIEDTTIEEILLRTENPEKDSRWLQLIDLDDLYANTADPISLNRDINYHAKDYVAERNKHVYERNASLDFVAHCNCGALEGNVYSGLRCSICGTRCRDDFSTADRLEHQTWLTMPEGILGVLHPRVYIVLADWLSKKGSHNWIDVIIDPTLDLPPELEGIVTGRGLNYLYENFDRLIGFFLHYYRNVAKSPVKRKNSYHIEVFLRNYRSICFCRHLPVMSSVLHSITSADGGSEGRLYADASTELILNAATDLANLEATTMRTRPNTISTVIHRIYKSYISYIRDIEYTRLGKKKSLIRRHVLGSRFHFSLRSVIIPHAGRYDELYLPWAITVNLLKVHIIGRLVKRFDMDIGEAALLHVVSLMRYDPLIDQIVKELIAECRPEFPGLPTIMNRNPSLRRGACQLLYTTRMKTDLADDTISLSTLILKDPGADTKTCQSQVTVLLNSDIQLYLP